MPKVLHLSLVGIQSIHPYLESKLNKLRTVGPQYRNYTGARLAVTNTIDYAEVGVLRVEQLLTLLILTDQSTTSFRMQ
jgi:hypothetical protein